MEVYFPRANNYAFTLEDRRVQLILILNNGCNNIFIMLVPDCKELVNASLPEGPLKNTQEIKFLSWFCHQLVM